MGSDRAKLISRCCYAAVTVITLSVMFWAAWCLFGLTVVQMSEAQRRALVDYSPVPKPLPTPTTLLQGRSTTLTTEETSPNSISKLPTTASLLGSRGEPKRKESSSSSMAKGDFASRVRSTHNVTAAASNDGATPVISSPPRSETAVILTGSSNEKSEEDRVYARRGLAPGAENRPEEKIESEDRRKDADSTADSRYEISPTKVHEEDSESSGRLDHRPADNSRDEARTETRGYSESSRRHDIQSSRPAEPETFYREPDFDREHSRSRVSNSDRRRSGYDDLEDERGATGRYDRRDRGRDTDDRYSKGDSRVYPDDRDRSPSREDRLEGRERYPEDKAKRGDDDRYDERYRNRDERPRSSDKDLTRYRDKDLEGRPLERDDQYRGENRRYKDRDDERRRDRDDERRRDRDDERSRDRDDERSRDRDDERSRDRDDDRHRDRDDDRHRDQDERRRDRDDERRRDRDDDRRRDRDDDRRRDRDDDRRRDRDDDRRRDRDDDRRRDRDDDRHRDQDERRRDRDDDRHRDQDERRRDRDDERIKSRDDENHRSRDDERYRTPDEYRDRGGERYRSRDDDTYRSRDDDTYRSRDDDTYRSRDDDTYRSRDRDTYRSRDEGRNGFRDDEKSRSRDDKYRGDDRHGSRDVDRDNTDKTDRRDESRSNSDLLVGERKSSSRYEYNLRSEETVSDFDLPIRDSSRSHESASRLPRPSQDDERRYRESSRDYEYRRPSGHENDRTEITPTRTRAEILSRSTLMDSRPRGSNDDSKYVDDPRDWSRDRDRHYDQEDRVRSTRIQDSKSSMATSENSKRYTDDNDRYRTRLPDERTEVSKLSDRREIVIDQRSYASENIRRDSGRDNEDRSRRPIDDTTRRDKNDDSYSRRDPISSDEYKIRRTPDYERDRSKSRDSYDDNYRRHDDRYNSRDDDRYSSRGNRPTPQPARSYDTRPDDDGRPRPRDSDLSSTREENRRDREEKLRPISSTRDKDRDGYVEPKPPPRGRYDVDLPISNSRDYSEGSRYSGTPRRPASTNEPMLGSSMTTIYSREPSVVVVREKRFESTENKYQSSRTHSDDVHDDRNFEGGESSRFPREQVRPLSAQDVIEAAIRHSDASDQNSRKVYYPVFDPRLSNLTSPEIIRQSERRGTTITVRRRRFA